MRDRILQTVKEFLSTHYHPGRPLLVGCSGGPDSLALVHLLLECRRFFQLDLQIAHVDHGWREKSKIEAEELKDAMTRLNLPFHLQGLQGVPKTEVAAREARLQFFQELYKRLGCQALLLGHHGDDQSETVLKRILEGAGLTALGGIKAVTDLRGMQVWRPLLTVSKADLKIWLKRRGIEALDDETNLDPRYLRARMRQQILPELERQFGKQVRGNLQRLGRTAQELQDYLDSRLKKYNLLVQGGQVDLSPFYPFESFEIKVFLKQFAENHGILLSHAALETLYYLLEEGASHRRIGSEGRWIEVRGRTIKVDLKS